MKPHKRLILGLRETAQELREHPEHYLWWESEKCNCGLLAQHLGLKKKDIAHLGSWGITLDCGVTGLPVERIFTYLFACGLEPEDFSAVENAGSYPPRLADWFDQKADELERRRVTEKGGDEL